MADDTIDYDANAQFYYRNIINAIILFTMTTE
jgi:hypothetical protein